MQSVICPIRQEVDVYVAMGRGGALAKSLGFNKTDRTRIEIVILELARNILAHANNGELLIDAITVDGHHGLVVESRDHGPGIADIDLAMRDGYSTTQTLGAGLPGVRRLMDDFEIRSDVGVGTYVRAIKWLGHQRVTDRKGGRLS